MRPICFLTIAAFIFCAAKGSGQITHKLYTPGGVLYPTAGVAGVGINVDRPGAALHIIQSDDKSTALRVDLEIGHPMPNGSAKPEFAFTINTFTTNFPNQISRLLSVDINGKTRIGYYNTGNEKLMEGNSIGIYKSSPNTMIRLGYDGSSSQPQLVWNTSNGKNFQFKNVATGAIPISLSPDGKVGINTDDFFRDHNLYVDGSVYIKDDGEEVHSLWIEGSSIAEEMFVKIKDATWGDYVFKDDYMLLTLNELENFISEKGHLPEMPTAAEVEEEGVKTGETLRLLTIKVEELTLYILQQQKEIEALKEKLEKTKTDENK